MYTSLNLALKIWNKLLGTNSKIIPNIWLYWHDEALISAAAAAAGRDEKQTGRATAHTGTLCLKSSAFESDKTLAFAKIVDLQSFYRKAFQQQIQYV